LIILKYVNIQNVHLKSIISPLLEMLISYYIFYIVLFPKTIIIHEIEHFVYHKKVDRIPLLLRHANLFNFVHIAILVGVRAKLESGAT